ncbi:MAG: transposase [Patescibacteria group bacterium]
MPHAVIVPDEYYHIFNRAINKQIMFLDKVDHARMLCLLILAQSSDPLDNVGRRSHSFLKNGSLNLSKHGFENILKNRVAELAAFVIMPNHFHIIVKELVEGGISLYLQKIEIAYTKYFNTKYHRSGYLFQGSYQSVHVEDNDQLLHLSAYIHRNSRELKGWRNKEHLYQWSSFFDLVQGNRWGELLKHEILSEQFKNPKEYFDFVKTSGTKELEGELLID